MYGSKRSTSCSTGWRNTTGTGTAATATRGTRAGPVASPTGMGAGATGNRKLAVTGGWFGGRFQ